MMQKKLLITLGAAAILFGAGCSYFPIVNNSSAPANTAEASETQTDTDVVVLTPTANQMAASPLVVEGTVKGGWFFEAQFPIRIVDANEQQIGTGTAHATNGWQAMGALPFSATITFTTPTTTTGTLILMRDNPSGLPANDDSFRVPVQFAPVATMTAVKLFFENEKLNLDPTFDCKEKHPVTRVVTKTSAIGRAALVALLAGPTPEEQTNGYRTGIRADVVLNSLTIVNGVATADFNDRIAYQPGNACGGYLIGFREQIVQTLKQFTTIHEVKITVNGAPEGTVQP